MTGLRNVLARLSLPVHHVEEALKTGPLEDSSENHRTAFRVEADRMERQAEKVGPGNPAASTDCSRVIQHGDDSQTLDIRTVIVLLGNRRSGDRKEGRGCTCLDLLSVTDGFLDSKIALWAVAALQQDRGANSQDW